MILRRPHAFVVPLLALWGCGPGRQPDASLDAAMEAAIDASGDTEASLDATDTPTPGDDGVSDDVRVVPQGLAVTLRSDGRVDVDVDGVPLDGLEFVVRFADGTERLLSALSVTMPTPTTVMATDATGLQVTLALAPVAGSTHAAQSLTWTVQTGAAVQGVELRSALLPLPSDARMVMEGAQSWSFAGPLALAEGMQLTHTPTGAVVYPPALGDPTNDHAGLSWFRGDLVWASGGLSVCATAPYDRALAVVLERPTRHYAFRVSSGMFVDEVVTPSTTGTRLSGGLVLARAMPAQPFACTDDAPPPARTRGSRPFPHGWWSWNTLFTNVTGTVALAQLPLLAGADARAHHVTIDDGWENAWGDWHERAAFGTTLASLATQLQGQGDTLGVWLAPFAVDPSLPLASAHPDWFVRDTSGAALQVMLVPGRPYLVLDATHPDVQTYLAQLFGTLRAQGLRLFKIDFLYVAAQPGVRHDPTATGLQAYRLGLQAIAMGAGDAHLNGCGAFLLPSLPFVDSIRVGADNTFAGLHPSWGSVAQAARNLATRSGIIAQGVAPDPDQPIVRVLTADEGRAYLAVGALSGGTFGYGDDLTALPTASQALFAEAWFTTLRDGITSPARPLDFADAIGTTFLATPIVESLGSGVTQARPPTQFEADLGGTQRAVVIFNWTQTAGTASVPAAEFAVGSVPTESVANTAVTASGAAWVVNVPPHAVRVLLGAQP